MAKQQHNKKPATPAELKAVAEDFLELDQLNDTDDISSYEGLMRLNHELSVHQIELEMQLEALQESRKEVEESLSNYLEFYDWAPLGYLTIGRDSKIFRANLTATIMLGVDRSRLQGIQFKQLIVPEDYRKVDALLEKVFNEKVFGSCEVRLLTVEEQYPENGRIFRIDAGLSNSSAASRIVLSDISEQKRTENELYRLTRALLATNHCNQALIHSTDEIELLQKICSIMVDIGGYRMAWVGYAENDQVKSIHLGAHAGVEEGYFDTSRITWADSILGQGPKGTAIRTGEPFTIRDIQKDPKFEPWRSDASKRGYASLLSLPLKSENEVFGSITIYSEIPSAFNTQETILLTALADNVAYGITMLRNNAARQTAEEELRQSDARYRSLFQNKHTVMLIIDQEDGTIVDANPSAVTYYGWSLDELCRMNIKQINHLTDQEIHTEMQLAVNEKRNYFLCHHLLADGSIRDVEVFSGTININNKSLLYSIINDITERKQQELLRKQHEHELQESQQFLSSIYDAVNNSIFVVDVRDDGGFRFKGINPMHEKLTGFNNEDIRGKTPEELFDPEVAKTVSHNCETCIREGKTIKYEEALPFLGKMTWWETVLNPVRNDWGYIYRIIGTATNITERKLAEKKLKKLSAAIEQSPSLVVITDPSGNIEYVNPMFTRVTGYSAEEVKGKNPRILKSGLMPVSVYEELWKTILSGQIWYGELQNKKKNGELYWDQAVISAIRNNEGVVTNFVAVKLDVTEQKKMLDELIVAKEKAEESDHLKSAFLANISHEIRTPMNGILGFSELLSEPQLSGEEMAEYIKLIHKSGERMLNLINDLIDISRIDARETKLHITETQLNELMNDLQAFFKPEAESKGLRLTCTTGMSDSESFIKTDSVKLNQILTNLVKNALKFTTSGCVDFGYTRKDVVLEFYVIDSGIGVPEDMKEKVFDRFQQVDNTLTRGYEGAGLGLSISKAFVEMLGGKIGVESVEGGGSKFFFTLEYIPADSALIPKSLIARQEQSLPDHRVTILIVEDDEVSSLLLKKSFKEENIQIYFAENGQQAISRIKQYIEIDLVLMDIKMPEMNGYDATKQIKLIRPDLPVIAQTAFTSKEDRDRAKRAGCDRFITKPVKKSELLEMMKELLHW